MQCIPLSLRPQLQSLNNQTLCHIFLCWHQHGHWFNPTLNLPAAVNTNLTARIYVHFCKPQICWNSPCLFVANLCFFRLNLCCDNGGIMIWSWSGLGKDRAWLKIPALVSLNLPEMSWLLIKNISFVATDTAGKCRQFSLKLIRAVMLTNVKTY